MNADTVSWQGAHSGCRRLGADERLHYGKAAREVIVQECARLRGERVFLLTNRSLAGTPLLEGIARHLGRHCVGRYEGFTAHTPRHTVLAAAAAARAAGADALVALGGGSVIDGAKVLRLCLAMGVASLQQLQSLRQQENTVAPLPHAVPLLAVPTTLSGAEFTDIAGVSGEQGRKERFGHGRLRPEVIVLDPEATLPTPLPLFLSTGVRAVDHAIETVCSPACDPLAEVAALRGLGLLAQALHAVARDPSDADARLRCQLGSWLAAMGPAGGVPMGASHGIGHVLGAEYGVPHGITSCVTMAAVLAWNRPATLDRQRLLEAQLPGPGGTAAERVDALLASIRVPRRLREAGIRPTMFEHIARRAMEDFCIPANPRPIAGPADILEILRLAA